MTEKRKYGTGHITKKGYIRGWGNREFEHRRIWRQHFGEIPEGYFIHHKNHDKQDNRIENLELVDTVTHKRLHSGCEIRDGIWYKPCHVCGEFKPIDKANWYFSKEGWPNYGRCRACHIKIVVQEDKRRLKRSKDKSAS